MKKANNKEEVYYVKINKTGEIVKYKKLFSKETEEGIYRDYSISNQYLIKKYGLDIDYNDLFEFIDQVGFSIEIDETKSIYAYYAVLKMKKYLKDEKIKDTKLNVFTSEDLDTLIEKIIKSFNKNYGYLMSSFKD
jgi:hypothetical protein